MMTWSKQIRCVLSSCALITVLFLPLKFPLAIGVVIYYRIHCVILYRAIVPVLLLSLKCPLTTGVVISCHSYWCRYLGAPYIENNTDRTQTKGLYLPC